MAKGYDHSQDTRSRGRPAKRPDHCQPLPFVSSQAEDEGVLADLLRTYGFTLVQVEPEEGQIRETRETPCLTVAWGEARRQVKVTWQEKGRLWHGEAQLSPDEPDAQEALVDAAWRRLLRLAFHQMLVGAGWDQTAGTALQKLSPHPWGVLTGVRPVKVAQRLFDQGKAAPAVEETLSRSYGLAAERCSLVTATAAYQRPYLPGLASARQKISLYLNYPFCPSRCRYCSFPGYEAERWAKWQKPYLETLVWEIHALGQAVKEAGMEIETVYFGGGTPTAMTPAQMAGLLQGVMQAFPLSAGAEWTVESGRPETLTREMLQVLADYPITRICINPQTMQSRTLATIGRNHGAAAIKAAFDLLEEFANNQKARRWQINSDLILGLPGEGLPEVRDSLAQVIALAPENITVHSLAIKRGSQYKEEYPGLPEQGAALAMTEISRQMLKDAGYVPYYLYRQKDSLAGGENVGYCLPGHHCLYNIYMIEERQTILGLGVGAGSKFLRSGSWLLDNLYNPKDLIQYIERAKALIAQKVDKLKSVG